MLKIFFQNEIHKLWQLHVLKRCVMFLDILIGGSRREQEVQLKDGRNIVFRGATKEEIPGVESSGGSRIFPRGGANSQKYYYFSIFCRKLHENERIWTPRGGARPWCPPPLDPPMESMVRNCAKRGDGFNVDEFCPTDGHFLHKFIFEPKVVIATDYKDEIQGMAICGFSTLSRVPGSLWLQFQQAACQKQELSSF